MFLLWNKISFCSQMFCIVVKKRTEKTKSSPPNIYLKAALLRCGIENFKPLKIQCYFNEFFIMFNSEAHS